MQKNLPVFLQSGAFPLFAGALWSDWTYWKSSEIQWINFSAWLLFGAALFTGLALLAALIFMLMRRRNNRYDGLNLALLAFTLAGAVLNSFVHARDVWATMPTGLWMSAVLLLMSVVGVVLVFRGKDQSMRTEQ